MEIKQPKRQEKVKKLILVAMCSVALLAFFLPAVNVEVSFLGLSTSTSFGMASLVNRPDNPFGAIDMPNLSQHNLRDLIDLSGDDNPFADVGTRLITSVAAYFITAVLLITVLICTIAGKLKKVCIALLALALALFLYARYMISTIPALMQSAFEGFLGFFAMFLNLSNIISISLGSGFWLTLIMIVCMLITKTIILISTTKQLGGIKSGQ